MSGLQRTAADDEEESRRATPAGFLEFAGSYRAAALALIAANVASAHAQAPVRLLRYHAVELYLKAFLRFHGYAAGELCGDAFGDIGRLSTRAEQLGLVIDAADRALIEQIAHTETLVRSRYFRTSSYIWPDMARLQALCDRLHARVSAVIANDKSSD